MPMTRPILHQLIQLIDFTRLIEEDSTEAMLLFCKDANTLSVPVASVCVYPDYVPLVKEALAPTGLNITTVANFPSGNESPEVVYHAIEKSLKVGADEIDVVIPYQRLIAGDFTYVETLLQTCRAVTNGHVLKVIIESGVLNQQQIEQATEIAININCDFIKTATGKAFINPATGAISHTPTPQTSKTPAGATPNAVETILHVLTQHQPSPGIKISGGIATPEEAMNYLSIIKNKMGSSWVNKDHVRIGASGLVEKLKPLLTHAPEG